MPPGAARVQIGTTAYLPCCATQFAWLTAAIQQGARTGQRDSLRLPIAPEITQRRPRAPPAKLGWTARRMKWNGAVVPHEAGTSQPRSAEYDAPVNNGTRSRSSHQGVKYREPAGWGFGYQSVRRKLYRRAEPPPASTPPIEAEGSTVRFQLHPPSSENSWGGSRRQSSFFLDHCFS